MRERKPFEERLFSSCALPFPNLFESSFPVEEKMRFIRIYGFYFILQKFPQCLK